MVTFPTNETIFCIASYLNYSLSTSGSGKVGRVAEYKWYDRVLNPPQCYFQFSAQTYFPLDEGDIFESKFPLVARIRLAARACGSRIGQSPSNSVRV